MSAQPLSGKVAQREASPSDLGFVLEIYMLNFRGIIEAARGWDGAVEKEYLAGEMSAAPFYILTHEGLDAGFLSYLETKEAVHIRHIEVHPDFGGRGIGTIAIRRLMRSLDGRALRVAVSDGNHRGMEFYTNLGFKEVGRVTVLMKGARGVRPLGKTLMQYDGR